jgi:hypothetical protein
MEEVVDGMVVLVFTPPGGGNYLVSLPDNPHVQGAGATKQLAVDDLRNKLAQSDALSG